jgi:ABC-type transporter Mla subunit MlaD
MTGKHGFLEALKEVAFEDEPAPPAKPAPAPAAPAFSGFAPATPNVSTSSPVPYALPIDAGVVPDSDAVYQALLSRTDFESTPTAATIHKFLDPLKAIPDSVMPSNVKFKTAVIQATAQAGLTQDGILSTFDTLTAKLQQEKDAFSGKSQQFAAREVAGRQDQIQKITEQITQLQQQLAQLSNELVDAQGKATHAQSQFEAAVQRRASELEQQKELYASLLKG